jgi:uncharacterized repeat protein (TIGR03803 family)
MPRNNCLGTLAAALTGVIAAFLVLAPGATAQGKYRVLHAFRSQPFAGLIFDQSGNLYGTTYGVNSSPSGTVFKLTPNPDGTWSESVLYSFCSLTGCSDGSGPRGVLIFEATGNLYGTTLSGGDADSGVVFKLTLNPDGGWSESVLYKFAGGQDGSSPDCGLIFDKAGNLYGTTAYGGADYYHGTVFKLTPNPIGNWPESVLYNFTGKNGSSPRAGMIFDQAGNLYGTTVWGGNRNGQCGGTGCGVVFKLTPKPDGNWIEGALHWFTGGKDGAYPDAGLIFDHAGNLYGMTVGGGAFGSGTVFKLAPRPDGSWEEKVLHDFTGGEQGGDPSASLIFDTVGSLYGTTASGGDLSLCQGLGCGVVFKLAPNTNGGWSETVLHRFYDHPGALPYAGVIFDAAGSLYGTTSGDGALTFGSVFEITP